MNALREEIESPPSDARDIRSRWVRRSDLVHTIAGALGEDAWQALPAEIREPGRP